MNRDENKSCHDNVDGIDEDNLGPKQQVAKLGESEEDSEEHDTKSSNISGTAC